MKKISILLCGILGVCGLIPISKIASDNNIITINAEEVTEAECEVVDIADLANKYAYNGAGYDNGTNGFSKIPINSCAAYFSTHLNSEFTGIINSSAAWVAFSSRTMTTSTDFTTSSGYWIRYYFNGRVDFYKNGTRLVSNVADLVATAPAKGVDHEFSYKTTNLSDGSVKISLSMDGQLLYTYTDTTDPILTPGGFYVRADSGTTVIKPSIEKEYDVDIFSLASPKTSAEFPASAYDSTYASLTGGAAGYDGVIFETQGPSNEFGYKVKLTPTEAAGGFILSIGGSKEATYQRPNLVDYWTETGYQFRWLQDGTLSLERNGSTLKSFGKVATAFASYLNTAFDIEIGFKQFELGNRVVFKMNDKILASYFDLASEENVVLKLPTSSSVSPSGRTISNGIWSYWSSGRIDTYGEDLYETKTVVSKDLGTPTTISNSAKFSKNGEPESFNAGPAFGYNANINNVRYQFNMNLSTVGNNIAFITNSKGTLDTPWGEGWTSKGYTIYLYANGQIILSKNGATLLEGWAHNSFSLTSEQDYLITIDSYMVSDSIRRIQAKINNTVVINYIDCNNPINQEGWFACYSTGCVGSITQTGYELPVVTANENSIFVNGTTTLSYSNPVEGDVVTYYIDEENSTGAGTLSGNVLTATGVGELHVYVIVNEIRSISKVITVEEAEKPVLITDKDTIKEKESLILSFTYCFDGFEGVYYIDESKSTGTGTLVGNVLTATKTGELYVYVVVDGETSLSKVITIEEAEKPVLNVDKETIKERESVNLSFTYCFDGFEGVYYIDESKSTGTGTFSGNVLTATGAGEIYVYVVVDNIRSLSKIITVEEIEKPVVIYDESIPLIVGGETIVLDCEMSDGSEFENPKYYVENISGKASVDENTGLLIPLAAGMVKVYAVVDGIESEKETLFISPKIIIKNTMSMAVGSFRDFEYEANCELPNENITVIYELLSGENVVSLNETTGRAVAMTVGKFTMRIRVIGETFQAVTPTVTMSVEIALAVITEYDNYMVVGQSQTVSVELGGGERPITSSEIEIISGGDLVEIDGLTITAKGEGIVKFRVILNGTFEGITKELTITNMSATLILGDMLVNDSQQLSVIMTDDNYTFTSIEYSILEGEDIARIEDGILYTNNNTGIVKVKVVVDGKYESEITIEVNSLVLLEGIEDCKEYTTYRKDLVLSYILLDDVDESNVIYTIVSGPATIEPLENKTAKLIFNGVGEVVVKVAVGEIESRYITICAVEIPDASLTAISASGAKKEFKEEAEFTTEGLVVIAHYSDGNYREVTPTYVSPVDTSKYGSYSVTITYTEGGVTKDTSYKVTVLQPVLQSIEVVSAKTEYKLGESFTTEGLVVVAHYDNDTTKEIKPTDIFVPSLGLAGTYEIIVQYIEWPKSTSTVFKVTVTAPTPKTLTVSGAKQNYLVGESFTSEGMVTTVHYSDGTSKEVTPTSIIVPEMKGEGTYQVIVQYIEWPKELTTSFEVYVSKVSVNLESITLSGMMTDFILGEKISTNSLVVTAHYDNGTSKEVTPTSIIIPEVNGIGTYQVIVQYIEWPIEVSTSYYVTVRNLPTELEYIVALDAKDTFVLGEEFTTEGLVVYAHYSDGTSRVVEPTNVVVEEINGAGTYIVLVEYIYNDQTYSAEYEIEYIEKENEDSSSEEVSSDNSSSSEENSSDDSSENSNSSNETNEPDTPTNKLVLPIILGSVGGLLLIGTLLFVLRKKIFKI